MILIKQVIVITIAFSLNVVYSQESSSPQNLSEAQRKSTVEDFTAYLLDSGEWIVGPDVLVGVAPRLNVGLDAESVLLGIYNLYFKTAPFVAEGSQFALGLQYGHLSASTLSWHWISDYFDSLSGEVFRPSVIWSRRISERLTIHTSWVGHLGHLEFDLSPYGKSKLWETKHPDEPYPGDASKAPRRVLMSIHDKPSHSQNQGDHEHVSLWRRPFPLQGVLNYVEDRFQITGEYKRKNGHLVLITSKIEHLKYRSYEAQSISLTGAHHWVFDLFQIRIGGGIMYRIMNGEDFDGEQVNVANWAPAADLAFYLRF